MGRLIVTVVMLLSGLACQSASDYTTEVCHGSGACTQNCGQGLPSASCACADGATCTAQCSGVECTQECGDDCTIDCIAGGCTQKCSGEGCRLQCSGGNCQQECVSGDCIVECAGGRCNQSCHDALCTFECDGGTCSQECLDRAMCVASCGQAGTPPCSQSCGSSSSDCVFHGGCTMNDCTMSCDPGGCVQTCASDNTCSFTCTGGACM